MLGAGSDFFADVEHGGFVAFAFADDDGAIEVLCAPPSYEAVKHALEAAGLKPEIATVTMRAENSIALGGEDAERMQKLLDVIEDLDDVQDVFHNAEMAESA